MAGLEQRVMERIVPAFDDMRPGAIRQTDAVWRIVNGTRKPPFLHGRHLWPAPGAGGAAYGQQTHLPAVHERREAGGVDVDHQRMVGHRQHLVGGAAIGHMHVADAAAREYVCHARMRRGADPGGADR